MLDDLRNSATQFIEEEPPAPELKLERSASPTGLFLGMTATQRFVLVLMIFLMVIVLGVLFLFATDSIYLPFF